MDALELTRGQNVPLPDDLTQVGVVLAWTDPSGENELDVTALLLGSDHKVRSDGDMVFYNQPSGAGGSVRHLGKSPTTGGGEDRLHIDLAEMDLGVHAVAISTSLDREDGGGLGSLDDLRLLVLDPAGQPVICYPVTGVGPETALLIAELYRRGDGWKVRAVGQGWTSGLVGLATDFGVTVDDRPGSPGVAPAVEPGVGDVVRDTAAEVPAPGPTVDLVPQLERMEVLVDERPLAPPAEQTDSQAADPGKKHRRSRGVVTQRARIKVDLPARRLAADESWQPARLFSISGVGAAAEQEKRATSAVLSTMMAVREFGRAVSARLGAPAGHLETYLETPFPLGETVAQPDGLLRVAGRGGRVWTAMVEVKTGSGVLRKEQIERYLDVAKAQGFDAVVSISNDISPGAGEHPVAVDRRKLKRVALHHVSWTEVLHDARMQLTHRGVADPSQAYVLSELIRYLEHPRSGAATFDDMGPAWVPVRQAVASGSLRATDRKVDELARSWDQLVRGLCLRLTSELGVEVGQVLPRGLATDAVARSAATVSGLVENGSLRTTLRVPGAVGPMTVVADLRTGQLRTSVDLDAPREGGTTRRVNWLLRQLKDAPDELLVEASFLRRQDSLCEPLRVVRADPTVLALDSATELRQLRLTCLTKLGTKRNGVQGAFIPSVNSGVEAFYASVVQALKPWNAPAPKMPAAAAAADGSEAAADPDEQVAEDPVANF